MKEIKIYFTVIFSMLMGMYFVGALFPQYPMPWMRGALIFLLVYFSSSTVSVGAGSLIAGVCEGLSMLPFGSMILPFLAAAGILYFADRFLELPAISEMRRVKREFIVAFISFTGLSAVFFVLSGSILNGFGVFIANIGSVYIMQFIYRTTIVFAVYSLAVLPFLIRINDK